ncbi:hypothetical protein ACWDSL_30385 [Streptomyces sp. NPDC000941]|uniref:hypothetical protein n=1 Tax=unclassified Streptomyces TaxID=2593676 RepID=UPI00117C8FD4|nr:hypothetical protein [Streptomyces sp. NBS 14/10]KAK1183205.1 hypothetical protein B7755_036785 [Streptomyces sp. NBS 14/10]NUP40027.1 hypothetical protein [Streptomyces sp.]NUS86272.1 hypothetical protein [Streptomyces sp.]
MHSPQDASEAVDLMWDLVTALENGERDYVDCGAELVQLTFVQQPYMMREALAEFERQVALDPDPAGAVSEIVETVRDVIGSPDETF